MSEHMLKPGDFIALRDPIAERLDELADMAEWWRKHRAKGRNPTGIRAGMVTLCEEVTGLVRCPPNPVPDR